MNLKKYQSIIENSISLVALKGVELTLTIGLIPYLIAKVGMHNYGVYAFAMAMVLFFVNILNYGFNLATVREIAKNKTDVKYLNNIFNEVLSVKLVLFGFLFGLFLVVVFFVPKFYEYKELYFYCSLLLFADLFSLRWFFYGLEKMKYITIISLFGNVIFVLLVLQFIEIKSDFVKIPLYESIGMSLITIVVFLIVVRKFNFKLNLISLLQVVRYLKCNFSSFVNLFLPSTYNLTIVFVVGLLGVPIQVSLIQIGLKFTAIFSTLIPILTNVFYPVVNRNKQWMGPMRGVMLFIGVVLTVSMYVFSDYILSNWIPFENDKDLSNMIDVVKIMSITPLFMAIVSSFGVNGLLVDAHDKLFSNLTTVSTVSMLIAAFIFVPVYPVFGGPFAFVTGKVVYGILTLVNYNKQQISND